MLGSPLWGSLYGAELTCWQNDLPLACGSLSLVATPSLSPACRAHSSFCQDEEKVGNKMVVKMIFLFFIQVLFLSPAALVATSSSNSSVELQWEESRGG